MQRPATNTTAMLSLIAAMAMTGANVPLSKMLLAEMPPEILLLLRFGLASLALMLLARGEAGPLLRQLDGRQWRTVAMLSVVGSVMFTWFVLEGVRRTSGASAGVILAALPAVVAAAGIVRGERLRCGEIAMIALAIGGVAMVHLNARGAQAPGSDPVLGNMLIACAVLCETAFVIGARTISGEVGPMRLSLAVALVGFAVSLPVAVPSLAGFAFAGVGAGGGALLVWYALTASVACTALWYRGVGRVPTWAAGLATTAVPVAALGVSAVVLGETIAPLQVTGAALVVGAIAAGALARR